MTSVLENMTTDINKIHTEINNAKADNDNNTQQIIQNYNSITSNNNTDNQINIPTGDQAPSRTLDLNDINLYESDSSVSSSSDKDSDGYFSDVERSPTLQRLGIDNRNSTLSTEQRT